MTLFILDTDHLSLWQRAHPQISQKLTQRGMSAIAITIITAEEQIRGRLDVIRHAEGEKRVLAYLRFRETLISLRQIPTLLDFSLEAEYHHTELKRQKIRIGAQDLRIAAIALSVRGTIVTRNRRDFGKIPGLLIEDWTV
ncbi:MAG: type II toxin-antitoxin system VapC family toxin [Leptolyngbya sp. Prado105]|jgi:tRNA(fMet)-specific endonuclease VapC|nr:type II toxin-antitoxin system VapC family toxin [Leptolyngbya sp. Prado105]